MVKWLQKNNYIVLLFIVGVFLFILFSLNTPKNISYEEIKVEQGDSLWSLSEKYRGKMSTEKWMDIVMVENDLVDTKIMAGKSLVIPLTEETGYFTGETIEVARDDE